MTVRPVVLAVDFGTTNTVGVARWGNRQPRRVGVDGDPTMPSAVLLGQDGRLIVGQDAVRLGRAAAHRLELRPKSRLDDDVILLGDRTVPVVDAVRAVLHRLCREVAAQAGAGVDHLVLTHPADWGAVRLGTFVRAASGLAPRISLVAEPVAAAASAAVPRGATCAVLDFGGGTCDAAVVRTNADGGYVVSACAGLPDLGGDDLDQRIVEHVLADHPAVGGRLRATPSTSDIQLLRDRMTLRWDARTAKELLSRHESAQVPVPGVANPEPLRRGDFERIVHADIDRAVDLVRDVIADAGPAARAVDRVVLVGGSSRIPALADAVQSRLNLPVDAAAEPESAVAWGALQVIAAEERPAVRPAPVAPVAAGPTKARNLTRVLGPVALAVLVVALLVAAILLPTGERIDGSPVAGRAPDSSAPQSGPSDGPPFPPAEPGVAVIGSDGPPHQTVPRGQPARVHVSTRTEVEVRPDRVEVTTAVPPPAGYRWVRSEVTVTMVSGPEPLDEATSMLLVDDRGQRIDPVRWGGAAPILEPVCGEQRVLNVPELGPGGFRPECQLFLVPNATPVVGILYDDWSSGDLRRGGVVLPVDLPATGATEPPQVVGEAGGPPVEVRLEQAFVRIQVYDVIEEPSAYLAEDARPLSGSRYVIIRVAVEPSGSGRFTESEFLRFWLLDDRGLPMANEPLLPKQLIDCPTPRGGVQPGRPRCAWCAPSARGPRSAASPTPPAISPSTNGKPGDSPGDDPGHGRFRAGPRRCGSLSG